MAMQLRPYQRECIDSAYSYYEHSDGDILWVLPTGAGKSVVQAVFIKEIYEQWPGQKVMLVSHVKELLEQNAGKILSVWPEAPIGIYSAGLGSKQRRQITVAGIQSCHKKAADFGHVDLIIIDEAHLVPKKSSGMYRTFIDDLRKINPCLKLIGMTATPYRLDSGLLHKGKDALFSDIAYEAKIEDLIRDGYLCPLISKAGATQADLSKVKVSGGEFVAGELERAMDRDEIVTGAIDEILQLCADRNKWIVFCAGVKHAEHVSRELTMRGIPTACVTGNTPDNERDSILRRFKAGQLRAVTNMNCLTTGFDAPDIDALIMLRPTLSPGLYVQMCGRGMRPHVSKANTLVLDFAGNIERHGPVDRLKIKEKKKKKEGEAPTKACESCGALNHLSVAACILCGHAFPINLDPKHDIVATEADVLYDASKRFQTVDIDRVTYTRHVKQDKADSMCVHYWAGLMTYREWICIEHSGAAGKRAEQWWRLRSSEPVPDTVTEALHLADNLLRPRKIVVDLGDKYPRIIGHREFYAPNQASVTSIPF